MQQLEGGRKQKIFHFFPSYFRRNRAWGTLYPLPLTPIAPGYKAGKNCAQKPGIYPKKPHRNPRKAPKILENFEILRYSRCHMVAPLVLYCSAENLETFLKILKNFKNFKNVIRKCHTKMSYENFAEKTEKKIIITNNRFR